LFRPFTSCFTAKKDVDGRNKRGHDVKGPQGTREQRERSAQTIRRPFALQITAAAAEQMQVGVRDTFCQHKRGVARRTRLIVAPVQHDDLRMQAREFSVGDHRSFEIALTRRCEHRGVVIQILP